MSTNSTKPTILVVDDEFDVQEMITTKFRKRIRKQELAFLFAYDGEEALRKLKECPHINIILTDINMPGMDGLTLLKSLNGFVGHAIIITAYGDYDRQRQAMHSGAFDFLNKPLDFEDLETTLARSFRKQAIMRQRIEKLNLDLIQAQGRAAAFEGQNRKLSRQNQQLMARVKELERQLTLAYGRIQEV